MCLSAQSGVVVIILSRDAQAANKLSQNELKPNAAYYGTHFERNVYLMEYNG